jgi:hypothetical protein
MSEMHDERGEVWCGLQKEKKKVEFKKKKMFCADNGLTNHFSVESMHARTLSSLSIAENVHHS